MTAKSSGFACLILFALCIDAGAACYAPGVYTYDNQTVNRRMIVNSGSTCRLRFGRSLGPMYSVEIPQRPSHGTVQTDALHTVIYTAHRGFVGRDTFIYSRRGLTPGGTPVRRSVRVLVTVVPSGITSGSRR
jgi:hypothetical protein